MPGFLRVWLLLIVAWPVLVQPPLVVAQATDIKPRDSLNFPGAALFNGQPPFLAGVLVDHEDGRYRQGDLLKVTFQAEQTAYLYLLYHQADGSSVLLFPNLANKDHHIPKGKKVQVPPNDTEFRFRIQKPFGQEVLQVIASTKTLPEFDDLLASATGVPTVSREGLTKLAQRLSGEIDTWTEHRVRIQTIEKPKPLPPSPPTPPARRFGLFVGIGKYQRPEFVHTHVELENSARVIHRNMLKLGGIEQDRARLLINEQATKAKIEESLTKWLPQVTQPGDTVFVYFSGHAGQDETTDPSEPDGLDESLAPYDFDLGTNQQPVAERIKLGKQTSISDNTLARWLQELNGRQVVLILDTCHSGGFVAGKGKGLIAKLFADEAARVKDISQMNIVVLASCAADEQSQFEGTKNQTMWFTFCLSEIFDKSDLKRPVLVRDAFEYTRLRMKQLLREANSIREQEPTMSDTALLPIALIP